MAFPSRIVLLACAAAAVVAAAGLPTVAAFSWDAPQHVARDPEATFWRLDAERRAHSDAALQAMGVVGDAFMCDEFTQTLDHFGDAATAATFQQLYCCDASFASGGASDPTIIVINGEGPMGKDRSPADGFVAVLAQTLGAKVCGLEHRFYGSSVPPVGMTVEGLKYLSVEQALADVDAFTKAVATNDGRVLVVGGSYSGALSAWFRLSYPGTADASYSSSGVVNAAFEFPQFDMHVGEAAGEACADVLRKTTAAMEADVPAAKKLFGIANPSSLADDDFWYMAADSAAMAVQYGHKADLCSAMTNATAASNLPKALADFTTSFWGADFPFNCFYNSTCLAADPAHWQPTSRSWRWQKCSQLAYFQVAPASGSIRSASVDLQYHLSQCDTVFGKGVTDPQVATAKINAKFGAAKPTGTNIYFSNGGDDPWSEVCVKATLSGSEPEDTAHCDGCGHCGDLGKAMPSDPPQLTQQRAHGLQFVKQWLMK